MVQPWKGCVGASLPGVRIPPLPPTRERGIPLVLLEQTGIFCFSGDVPTLCPPVQNRRRAQYTATFARRAHNETPPVSSAKIGMTTRELEPGMLIFGCKQKVQGPFVPGGPSCRCSALAEAEPLIRGGGHSVTDKDGSRAVHCRSRSDRPPYGGPGGRSGGRTDPSTAENTETRSAGHGRMMAKRGIPCHSSTPRPQIVCRPLRVGELWPDCAKRILSQASFRAARTGVSAPSVVKPRRMT